MRSVTYAARVAGVALTLVIGAATVGGGVASADALPPGLYVQVIDGQIQLSNRGGTTNFTAGQFGTITLPYIPSTIPVNSRQFGGIHSSLPVGATVSFEVVPGPRGDQVNNFQVAFTPPPRVPTPQEFTPSASKGRRS